jgi:hypothetical protein
MTFPLGETVELQQDLDLVGQQQRLDLAARRPPSESAITGDRSSGALAT